MLFDIHPKENRGDMYDREKELESLYNSLKQNERLVIIYGVRRTGKTSLMHVFLNQRHAMYVLLDLKQVYFDQGYVPQKALANLIANDFVKLSESMRIETGIDPDEELNLTELLKDINDICKSKKLKFVLSLDEAQYLRFGGSTRYDGIIAWAVDNLSNIMIMLTGSEIGMLKDFLRYDDSKAPLYGRFRNEVYLNRFEKEESMDFLRKGFLESGKDITKDELEDTVDNLDGIVGWLTYYGHYRTVGKLSKKEALEKVLEEGRKIANDELEGLIFRSRKRYLAILSAMASGPRRWSDIKAYTYSKTGKITDAKLTEMLHSLIKFGVVEKKDEFYSIIDPIVKYSL